MRADDPPPKKVALLVGVNKYLKPGFKDLQFAEADVLAVGEELKKLGFAVTVLLGSGAGEQQATKANIEATAQRIVRPLGKHDIALVMLSGHGQQLAKRAGEVEFGTSQSYYCPVEARLNDPESQVSLSFLLDDVLSLDVGRKMLLVDACRDVPADATPDSRNARGIEGRRINLPEGTGVYFSCSAGQMSFEKAELGHGLFTYCLLEGLRGQAASASGDISWSRLVAHVDERMTQPDIVKLMPPQFRQVPIPSGALPQTVLGTVRLAVAQPKPVTSPTEMARAAPGVLAKEFVGRRAGEVRELGGDLRLPMCWCPPGQFEMGSPFTEAGRSSSGSETPVDVTLSHGFWLGQTEVTQGQWETVMGTQPWFQRGNAEFYREGANYPVVYVDGHDALAFCQRLTETERGEGRLPEGWSYSLPTEAQWEYACRAGRTGPYNGDGSGVLGDYAWYEYNTDRVPEDLDAFLSYTSEPWAHLVAQKRPNRWGLYDMHGNVAEWCLDMFSPQLPGGIDPLIRTESSRRVLRGGGHGSKAEGCRSASRASILEPPIEAEGLRGLGWDDAIGFRIALGPLPRE